jgi:hypothetical protein
MPFGPVTLIFYWPKKIISDQPKGWPSFQALIRYVGFQEFNMAAYSK